MVSCSLLRAIIKTNLVRETRAYGTVWRISDNLTYSSTLNYDAYNRWNLLVSACQNDLLILFHANKYWKQTPWFLIFLWDRTSANAPYPCLHGNLSTRSHVSSSIFDPHILSQASSNPPAHFTFVVRTLCMIGRKPWRPTFVSYSPIDCRRKTSSLFFFNFSSI